MKDLSHRYPIDQPEDERPLPLIVAEKCDFPLQYYSLDNELWYSVLDWIKGIAESESRKVSYSWGQLKNKVLIPNQQLPYTASDGKKYQSDFTNDRGLYLIAQHLRVTKSRPVLDEIKRFLAAAGVFVDEIRRDSDKRAEFVAATLNDMDDPEAIFSQVLDRVTDSYRRKGKTDSWIEVQVKGIVTRKQFMAALQAAVIDASRTIYAQSTERLYKGLLDRTTAQLRGELNIKPSQNPRDYMGEYALVYIELTERLCRDLLDDAETVTFSQALEIIWKIAKVIHQQYEATQQLLGRDLLTGRPLLTDSN